MKLVILTRLFDTAATRRLNILHQSEIRSGEEEELLFLDSPRKEALPMENPIPY
jgi:hypothetical protein